MRLVANYRDPGAMLYRVLGLALRIAVGGKRYYVISVGTPPDQVERRGADASGGAKY